MVKMIFCSHGRLCEGMLDTLKFFSLYHESMQAIPFYLEGIDGEAMLDEAIKQIKEEETVIVFTDLFFGSVNQTVMLKLSSYEKVHIIAGMNLMIVLELASLDQPLTSALIEQKVKDCQSALVYTKTMKHEPSEEDE